MFSNESYYCDSDQLNELELITGGLAQQLAKQPELFNPANSGHVRYLRVLEAHVLRLQSREIPHFDDHNYVDF